MSEPITRKTSDQRRGPALPRQRPDYILGRVRDEGAVRVADLVVTLGVSDMTVRRDLGLLHERGLLEGAATGCRRRADGRNELHPRRGRLHARGRSDHTVILTGGVRTPSDALVGPLAVASLRSVHVDMVMMGVHGMSPRGFATPNILEADTNRALIDAGRRLIVLADHTKWGAIGISAIARLDEADTLITDTGLDPAARVELRAALNLVTVDPLRLDRARAAAGPALDVEARS